MPITDINPLQTLASTGTNQPPITGPPWHHTCRKIDHVPAINEGDPPPITGENTLTLVVTIKPPIICPPRHHTRLKEIHAIHK